MKSVIIPRSLRCLTSLILIIILEKDPGWNASCGKFHGWNWQCASAWPVFEIERILSFQENDIADRAIRSETLSLERLLVHTIYVRTHSRLSDLKTELQALLKDVECKYAVPGKAEKLYCDKNPNKIL